MRAGQGLFDTTGAVHAAAAFTPTGEVLLTREDVGRHNAVDKVIGRMLLDGQLPATGLGLFVSGRASFELVQKAWAGWLLHAGRGQCSHCAGGAHGPPRRAGAGRFRARRPAEHLLARAHRTALALSAMSEPISPSVGVRRAPPVLQANPLFDGEPWSPR